MHSEAPLINLTLKQATRCWYANDIQSARKRMPLLGACSLEHSRVRFEIGDKESLPWGDLYLSLLLGSWHAVDKLCPLRSSIPYFILCNNATLSHYDLTNYLEKVTFT